MSTATLEPEVAEEPKVEIRTLPWVKLGVDISECTTTEQAMDAAGLNWSVRLEGLTRVDGTDLRTGVFATVRSDTNEDIGIVRERYVPFANAEAFSFVDNLLGDGIELECAGERRDGREVFLVAKLPGTMKVAGDDFAYHLFFQTSHDGTKSISAEVQACRILCTNGMTAVVPDASQRWSITHVSNVAERITEAQETLKLAAHYREAYAAKAARLVSAKMPPKILKKIVVESFGGSEKACDALATGVLENLERSTTIHDEHRATAWGGLCAFTEYVDHIRPWRTDNSRLHQSLTGFVSRTRNAIARSAT